MCRLFAVKADRPVSARTALVSAPHALARQSTCDLRGECHTSGWGIGLYADGRPQRVRSTHPAASDPEYPRAAEAVSDTIIGHVRQASVGGVSPANTHPFMHGRWLFAHNGTVEGFAANPEPLRALIPTDLLGHIEGETDSEHLFLALLGRLADRDEAAATAELARFLPEISRLYPGTPADPTRLNIVLTNGTFLLASRWAHSLHLAVLDGSDRSGVTVPDGAGPAKGTALASEPVTISGWLELPDRCIMLVHADGSHALTRIE